MQTILHENTQNVMCILKNVNERGRTGVRRLEWSGAKSVAEQYIPGMPYTPGLLIRSRIARVTLTLAATPVTAALRLRLSPSLVLSPSFGSGRGTANDERRTTSYERGEAFLFVRRDDPCSRTTLLLLPRDPKPNPARAAIFLPSFYSYFLQYFL